MHPRDKFRFCPACGTRLGPEPVRTPLGCAACGLVFYFNTTCATAALVVREDDGRMLFIRRAKEPAKGLLAMPGGFIDEGETAEEGIRRECLEEVGFAPGEMDFLCSHPNSYHYKTLTYPVLDFFFVARARGDEEPQALDAVESVHWLDPLTLPLEEIAFPSMRHALQEYRRRRDPVRAGFLLPQDAMQP